MSTAAPTRSSGWPGLLARLLPPQNPRTCCPPGRLSAGQGPLIVVASIPRSGTHVLMDVVLNNFASYKRRPLYVNLDALVSDPRGVDELIRCGGYVVKTHFPTGKRGFEPEDLVRRVAASAVVLIPQRDPAAVRASTEIGLPSRASDHERRVSDFEGFWGSFPARRIAFDDLLDPDVLPAILDAIAADTAVARNDRLVRPPSKDRRTRVYAVKGLTRILGARSPVVNTTIGFALSAPASHPDRAAR